MRKAKKAANAAYLYITGKGTRVVCALFFSIFVLGFASISIYARVAHAATNSTINFQARVMTASGAVVADGPISVEFKIYNVASGGTSEWNDTFNLTAKNGYITTSLGSGVPFAPTIDWSQEHWLTMNINGDGEMGPSRMKMTAVPYSFRSGQADSLTNGSGTISASQLAQLAPGSVQGVNSANTALRINQTGAGDLLQLQGDGSNALTLSKAGDLTISKAITVGASTSTVAGTIRWSGVDFEGYDGSQWLSLTGGGGGGGTGNSSVTLTSSVANMAATATTQAGLLVFTSAIATSSTAGGTTGFVAPADGSFRSCVVNNNAAITAGSISVRWSVNGVSTGAAACTMNSTNPRYGASTIDAGVVNFNAGDTVNIAFESSGLTPGGSTEYTAYWTVEYGGNGVPSLAFVQGGNNFGATAALGTTDDYGLSFLTNGLSRLTVSNTGAVSIGQGLTIGQDLVIGTGLNVSSGGIVVSAGGVNITGSTDLNNSGIIEAGNITGVGSSLSASAGLVIATAPGNDLELDSGSGILVFNDSVLRRTSAGATAFELNDSANTTLSIVNTNATGVAGLDVEGGVVALSFAGDGSGLTGLDAGNITSGILLDTVLSDNVTLLDATQTFTALNTFNGGLVLGNTAATAAGTLRWNGLDFEGYNGSAWVSLTSGGGAAGAPGSVVSKIKSSDETVNNSSLLQNDDELGFAIDANDEWTFRFVVQANSGVTPGLQFAINAPAGAVCDISFIDAEGATTASNIGCGASSGLLAGNGATDAYEIVGSIRNGANAGNITLQWAQNSTDASNTTVFAGSYVNAIPVSGGTLISSNAFVQGGNSFGATAIIGTTDTNGLELRTNGLAGLLISDVGNTTITGIATISNNLVADANTLLNGDVFIGNASTDVLTINSNTVSIPNGLSIDNGTLTINSALNTVGINTTANNKFAVNTAATADAAAEVLIFTDNINNKGLVLQAVNGQIANLFEVQNSSGATLISIDKNGSLQLGNDNAVSQPGIIVFNDGASLNGFTAVLGTTTLTNSRNINLPDEGGILCIRNSTACGFIVLGSGSAQGDGTNNSSIFINKTGASGDMLTLQKNGTSVMRVLNSGALQLQLNDTAALNVKNAGGTQMFNTDTTGAGLVKIGGSGVDSTATFLVLDSYNGGAADPAGGVDGASYYNTVTGTRRCYENGYWADCSTTRVQSDITLAAASSSISLTLPSSTTSLTCHLDFTGRSAASLIYLRFNNVSTAGAYAYNVLQNLTGASNNTTTVSSASATEIRLNGSSSGTSPGTATIRVNNFSAANKAVDWTAGSSDASGVVPNRFNGSGSYFNNTSQITSVQFLSSAGNFNSGTRAWCESR